MMLGNPPQPPVAAIGQPPVAAIGQPPVAAIGQPPAIGLAWHISVKVVTEGIVAALALLAAAVTGDVALVAFATPLAIAAVFALTRTRPVAPSVELAVTPIVSGPAQPIEVRLTLGATTTCICRLTLVLPPGLASDDAVTWTVLVRRGRAETLACTLRAARAGRFALGNLLVRVT
ncbi:MAG: hypothetical protein ABSE47_16380, partial [Acidimicrobiales bacterium]